ncbi:MAG: hypothetical protein KGH66_02235 [Candidatus Micrarchaeota archaeon]|nr:hypothetical protein [Candidatus Micrarchaeota archaeon]
MKAQSAMEYLTTYGWALLIVGIVTAILYLYSTTPTTIVPTTCVFVTGAYCNAIVVGANSITHATTVALFLTNSQPYPIATPYLYAQLNGANTTQAKCSPNYVVQAGSMICVLNLPIKSSLGQFLAGRLYLNVTYCGINPNYTQSNLCSGAPRETYAGKFTSHIEPLINTNTTITLTASNSTQAANNARDPLVATVKLLGYPLSGATVNFTANVLGYTISPNYTTTNTTGKALSYISGSKSGNVLVTASYAGLETNTLIQFVPAYNVKFDINWPYCSQAGQIITIDGISYTCSQLSSSTLSWGSGTTHSCVINNPVTVNSLVRGQCSITSGSVGSVCTANSNTTITINCTTQYLLTMSASPSSGGSVSPTTNWYNAAAVVPISQSANSGFQFNGWTGTGTVSYTGASSSASITMNSPISEISSYVTNVVFTESGLPGGTQWSVTLNGNTIQSTGTSITYYNLAPGSYPWSTASTVSCGMGCQYLASATSGTVSTSSGSAIQQVSYTTQYYLTMTSGSGGSISPASGWYNSGSQTTITATPSSGYYLQDWSGTGAGSYSGTTPSTSVTINGPITEAAAFQNGFYLTIASSSGGTASPSSAWYAPGSAVTITATPSSGYGFTGWSGSGTGSYSGASSSATVTLNSNITETASFSNVPQSYSWTQTASPAGCQNFYQCDQYGCYTVVGCTSTSCSETYYTQPNCAGTPISATSKAGTCPADPSSSTQTCECDGCAGHECSYDTCINPNNIYCINTSYPIDGSGCTNT